MLRAGRWDTQEPLQCGTTLSEFHVLCSQNTSYPQPCTVLAYRSHKWVVRCTQIMNLNFEFEFEFITVLTQEFSRHNFFTTVCCIIVISLKY